MVTTASVFHLYLGACSWCEAEHFTISGYGISYNKDTQKAHTRICMKFERDVLSTKNCPFARCDLDPILYMVPWAYLNPKSKRHLDRFSRFCTAHGRTSLYFTMGCPFPSKLPLAMGDLHPNLIHDSLGPTWVHNPNGISMS